MGEPKIEAGSVGRCAELRSLISYGKCNEQMLKEAQEAGQITPEEWSTLNTLLEERNRMLEEAKLDHPRRG